jgi:hypothetical protein
VSLRLAGLMHPDSLQKWQRYADMAAQALQRNRCLNVELSESDDIKLQVSPRPPAAVPQPCVATQPIGAMPPACFLMYPETVQYPKLLVSGSS